MASSKSTDLLDREEDNASAEGDESSVVGSVISDSTASSALKPESQRVTQAVTITNRGSESNVVLMGDLPTILQSNIIARLPLKNFFQVATLSKAWRQKLQSVSFQREVQNSLTPSTWGSYAPLFLNQKNEMVGYESSSGQWQRLPSHSYIAEDLITNWTLRAATGSLLCWTTAYGIYVTNPLTRSWKRLPFAPLDFPQLVHVVFEEKMAYKVISITVQPQQNPRHSVSTTSQVFESTTSTWTVNVYNNTAPNVTSRCYGSACVSGVLYLLLLGRNPRTLGHLIIFDVKEKTWNEIPIQHQLAFYRFYCLTLDTQDQDPLWRMAVVCDMSSAQVVVCGSNVMLVFRSKCAGAQAAQVVCSNFLNAACLSKWLELQNGLARE